MSEGLTQGQRIRKLRVQKRYTQEYLAQKLNSTKQAVHKYETDIVKNIPYDKLMLLADILECSISYLKCETDDILNIENIQTTFPKCVQLDNFLPFHQEITQVLFGLSPQQREMTLQFAKFLLEQNKSQN